MIVAQPIETSGGQVLCSKGTKLTEGLVSRLGKLDITHITVEGHPVDDGRPVKTLADEMAKIDTRFKAVMDNKLMAALKMVVAKHIQKKHEILAEEMAAAEEKRQENTEAAQD